MTNPFRPIDTGRRFASPLQAEAEPAQPASSDEVKAPRPELRLPKPARPPSESALPNLPLSSRIARGHPGSSQVPSPALAEIGSILRLAVAGIRESLRQANPERNPAPSNPETQASIRFQTDI